MVSYNQSTGGMPQGFANMTVPPQWMAPQPTLADGAVDGHFYSSGYNSMVDHGGMNVPSNVPPPVPSAPPAPPASLHGDARAGSPRRPSIPHTSGSGSRSASRSGSGSSTFSQPHRSRSSVSTEPSTEPPSEPPEPPKKKPNNKGKSRRSSSQATAADDDDPKRQKVLERNRVAASKCRKKKKEWVSELQETKAGLETQHQQLQREYNGLLDEVSRMKNELITHAHCNDPNIDLWLDNEAKRFVQKATERYSHAAHAAHAPPLLPPHQQPQPPAAAGPSGFTDVRTPSVASTRQSFDGT